MPKSAPPILIAALLLLVVAVPAASASTWTVRQLDDGPTEQVLWGVSCPSESLCVAVGSNGTIANSTDPSGGAKAWRTVHPEGYFSLPSMGRVLYPGNAIRAVSCPTTGFCAAAGPQGNILTSTDPTGGVGAWRIAELGAEARLTKGISCPSPSLCVAVGYGGRVVSSTDPGGGPDAWTVAELAQPLDLLDVSCPTAAFCAAVGNDGHVLASTDPTGGAAAWRLLGTPAGPAGLDDVHCPSPALCVTANAGEIVSSTDPTAGAGAWHVVRAGTGLPVKGLSCPTTGACAAVDNNADAIVSTNPTGGAAAWSFTNVIPAPTTPNGTENGMFAISCASPSLCVAAGNRGRIIASTDPFATSSRGEALAGPGAGKGKGRGASGLRVHLAWHPPKRVEPRRHGARVAFRFRADRRGARFLCKLDRRRAHRCRSPRRYRVGGGKHRFRVWAVVKRGRRLFRSRPATFHFRVGRVTERPPVGSCKPGQESRLGKPCLPAGGG